MDDRLRAVEAELERLARQVAALQQRLDRVESSAPGRVDEPDEPPLVQLGALVAQDVGLPGHVAQTALTALGRSLIILGGAYLLRAVTEGGVVPAAMGVPMGLLYAGVWLWAAARAGSQGQSIDAGFHGGVAVIIAFPLLVEAMLRFGLVSPPTAAVMLTALAAAFLWVAWRVELHALAWFAVGAAITTGLALMVRSGAVPPFAAGFVALGIGTLWLGYDRNWTLLRWPAALIADVIVAGAAARVTGTRVLDPPALVLTLQVALLLGYLGSFAIRTLVRGRNVIPFEVAQTAAVLVVGLGGGLAVSQAAGGVAVAGWIAVALALAGYAVAFAFVGRRQGRGANFYFYSSLALVCALAGSAVLPSALSRAVLWSGLALATAFTSSRMSRVTLSVHGAVYLVAAALAAGMPSEVVAHLAGSPVVGALPGWPTMAVVMAACGMCVLPIAREAGLSPLVGRLPHVVSGAVFVSGAAAFLAAAGVGTLEMLQGHALSAGAAATMRTAVLSGGAAALAALAAWPRLEGLGVFVYPTLAIAGMKLLVIDLRESDPSTLFAAFAVYGLALVAAPRLARRAGTAPGPGDAAGGSGRP